MSNITGILSLAAMSGAWIEMNERAREEHPHWGLDA
jgi:hypothetical protein